MNFAGLPNIQPSVSSSEPGASVHPNDDDIILGRGVLHASHPGNVRFYRVIDEYIPIYDAATTRREKTKVVQTIYQILTARGRFVKDDPASASCVVVEVTAAKKKIGHAIRFRRGLASGGSSSGSGTKRPRPAESPRDPSLPSPQPPQPAKQARMEGQEQPKKQPSGTTLPESPKLFSDEELQSVLLPLEIMATMSMNFEDYV